MYESCSQSVSKPSLTWFWVLASHYGFRVLPEAYAQTFSCALFYFYLRLDCIILRSTENASAECSLTAVVFVFVSHDCTDFCDCQDET